MLPTNPKSYDDLVARFAWQIPDQFNIGTACSDRLATTKPDAPAIIEYSGNEPLVCSFRQLSERSTRFAAALEGMGAKSGDRIAIMLPQGIDAAVAHLGTYKLGAITVPLATQFGPQAMLHRLQTSGAKFLICDQSGADRFEEIRNQLSIKTQLICTERTTGVRHMEELISAGSSGFKPHPTGPNDPAMMLFTSGTTGQPKGALHGHRVLLGHLPGIQMAQGFMPQNGDRFWTPSDWAWAGGLLNALLPALYFGVPVAAARAPKFEPDWALNLIKQAGVRNIFMPPTALKLMQETLEKSPGLNLRSLACAGEALGKQSLAWAKDVLGIKINEFYGQTECNAIISACHEIDVIKSGSMGKAVPGHRVCILGSDGEHAAPGTIGEIAVHKDSPVMFTGYFEDESATKDKFIGDWMLTGDRGSQDAEGYFHFLGRNDDVITSAGYRIGPSEIEDCLIGHPAVSLAAVTGKPDEMRTETVTAHIKLAQNVEPSPSLEQDIRNFVKTKLSAHEYPRDIYFVDDIPLTESGKVIRRHFR